MATNKIQAQTKADIEDSYRISVHEEASYSNMFRKLDTQDDFLSGKRAVHLLRKSGLPQETLAKVWALSDQDLDGRLSLKEFCTAMNLVHCVRQRGLPVPEPVPHNTRKVHKRSKKLPPGQKQTDVLKVKSGGILPRSPQRRSRMASLIGSDQQLDREAQDDDANKPKWDPRQTSPGDREQSGRQHDSEQVAEELTSTGHRDKVMEEPTFKMASLAASQGEDLSLPLEGEVPLREAEGGNPEAPTRGTEDARGLHETIISNASIEAASYQGGNGGCGLAPPRRRRPNLHQLNANDVNAVFAEGQRAINSLRDVQSSRVLVRGIDRLSAKDMARWVPVKMRARRRHTLPQTKYGEILRDQAYLPGRGRRTSLLTTAYEPAALFLKKRAQNASAREMELEQATATAAEKWKLKPLPEYVCSGEVNAEQIDSVRGHLVVAGLPLLDEDIDVIVHLLRRNHGFKRLDLSRCFLSDKHFVALAQALAWNCRIEEVCLKECVFTGVGAAALADVLIINNHIDSIDIRACQGLEEEDLKQILRAASKKANVKKFNGMELAALRAEDSEVLDLSGWKLGYVEAVVVAHCLGKRANGLQRVDLHNNSITTEAFSALMVALRKQSQLRSLDLSQNQIDERTLPEIAELLNRNSKLADVKLTENRVSCTEFEHVGLNLMKVLSGNNIVTAFDIEGNDVSPKMLTVIAEKLAANRAVRKDMTFVDCLRMKYPRVVPRPVLADPRKLHLADADVHFMAQERVPAVKTTVRTDQQTVLTPQGAKPGLCLDFFFIQKCEATGN